MAELILILATLATVGAHVQQGVHALRKGSAGVSLKSELANLVVSGGLLFYATTLHDAPLTVCRVLIVGGWLFRLAGAAWAREAHNG